jgi:hypothetical protein
MKTTSFLVCVFTVVFSLSAFSQNTITTSTLTQTSFCAGGNIIVQYTSTGTFPLGCTFSAELSDASGNFSNPVVVGSVPLNLGVIAGTIPSNTPFGFNYRVRVVASNPYTVGSESSTPLIITSTAISATIIANPSTEICHGETISLWVTFNASYYWSTGETTQTIHVTESGSYTCTVINYLTGCEVTSDSMNITVHPTPNVNLGPNLEQCDGQIIILDAGSGYSSYQWNDNTSSQFLNVDSSGTYLVTVIDSFGCTGGDTITALFHQNPVVDLGADTNLCGNSFLLSAEAGYNLYNWNNGLSFNPTFLVDTSGLYFVSVVDSNGCSDRDSILISIHPVPVINLGNDLSACGSSILLDAGSGFSTYNWNNGLNLNQFFAVTSTGIYFVKVTDAYGCFNTDTINIAIHPLPDINLGPDTLLSTNDSLIIDAGSGYSSYQWSTGQNTESIIVNGWDNPVGPLNIDVTLTDIYGCSDSDQIVVTIVPSNGMDGFIILPNPFHDVLQIFSSQDLSGETPVFYDMLGNYYYPEFSITGTGMTIRRGNIACGTYVLFFSDKEGFQVVRKLIIY